MKNKYQKEKQFGKNNPNYKNGKRCNNAKFYCIDCNQLLSEGRHIRCNSCAAKQHSHGRKNSNWKGGRYKNGGYIYIYKPTHPFAYNGRYIREHRLIIEKKIGRYLHRWEVVHHINGVKDDNKLKNLKLFKNESEHRKFHHLIIKKGGSH